MKKIYSPDRDDFIVYHNTPAKKNKDLDEFGNISNNESVGIIFVHGLMSDMNSSKALALEEYCLARGYDYTRFDNFGSGSSSGEFVDQSISTWVNGLKLVMDELSNIKNQSNLKETSKFMLIGSSKGGWVSLLAGLMLPELVHSIITIAAAPDFTEELMWKNFSDDQKTEIESKGILHYKKTVDGNEYGYPISWNLIEDGRRHRLLNKDSINISCPVHLIHGIEDKDVPYDFSLRAASKIIAKQVVTKLVKDAGHKLAREQDIRLICNSIEELLCKT